MTRAAYRGYVTGGNRSRQVRRLHIIREHGPGDRVASCFECGNAAWNCQASETVIIDPMPAEPPAGLEWCPSCVGRAADRAGLLRVFAATLARGHEAL